MAAKRGKTPYDDLPAADPAAEPSLEEILAEYGGSRRQRLLKEVDSCAEHPEETEQPEETEAVPSAPAPADGAPPRGETAAPEPPIPPRPAAPEPEPAPEEPAGDALPRAPRPISMEEVVGRTVDAVKEEEELLPEKKRRRGLFSRRELRDTEALYETPAPPREEEPEPIGPEPPLNEAAADCHRDWARLRRPLPAASVLTLLLAGLTAASESGVVIPLWSGDPRLQAAVSLAVLVAVCLLCRAVFVRCGRQLARRRCTGDTLIALSALAAAADCAGLLVLPGRSACGVYAPCACAALCVALWGAERESRGLYDTYRAAALGEPPYLVTETAGGACKQPGRIEGFWTDTERPGASPVWQSAMTPVILAATVVFAGLASLGQGRGDDFLLCWSALLAASASFALPISWAIPFSRLASQLQKDGCAVAGWAGAEAISRRSAMILTDADLFPPGAIRLNGIKVFGEELPRAVSYAATLARASGSGLTRLFDGLVRSEGGELLDYTDFSFYEEGGASANIRGETVLLGTASFLRKMDVRLPDSIRLPTGVFLAVDRQLTAVFAVKYQAAENVDWALKLLRRSRITPILAARDPNITPALLKRKFSRGVRVEYPPLAARLALSEAESVHGGLPRALLFREGLLPYAETVTGSRRLVRSVRRSLSVALFGSAAGTVLVFYLAFLGRFSLMGPVTLLAFQLLWALAGLLLTSGAGR